MNYTTIDTRIAHGHLVYVPNCWIPVKDTDQTYSEIEELEETLFNTPVSTTAAVAFLHQRQSITGNKRLICVQVVPDNGPDGPEFFAYSINPGSLKPDDDPTLLRTIRLSVERGRNAGRFRLFAGQPDTADPSHFTINYQLGSTPGTIDGWLEDNDRVRLKPRIGWTESNGDRGGNPDEMFWYPQDNATNLDALPGPSRLHFSVPPGGAEECYGVVFSNDSRLLAVLTYAHIFIEDMRSGRIQAIIAQPVQYGVPSMVFSPDSRALATALGDGRIEFWRTRDGRYIGQVKGPAPNDPNGGIEIAYSPDGLAVFSIEGAKARFVTQWNIQAERPERIFTVPPSVQRIDALAVSKDGKTLLGGGAELVRWDVKTGRTTRTNLPGIGCVAGFSGDATVLVAQGVDQSYGGPQTFIASIDAATGKAMTKRFVPDAVIDDWPMFRGNISSNGRAFGCVAEGCSIGSRTFPGGVCVWDLPAAKTLWEFPPPSGAGIGCLSFSPDGHLLAAANGEKTLLLWQLPRSLGTP